MFQIKTKYVLLATTVLMLPLLVWRDFTPDNELRYLSIADDALRNGSLFAFSNHGVPYADKPPLYLWLLMACRWLCGGWEIWAVGLLSLIPTLVTVGIMERWTRNYMPTAYHLPAVTTLITTGLFLGAAIVIRMDALMMMFIVLAVQTFYNMYSTHSSCKRLSLTFPLYLFLALFTKGPLGILIPLVGITLFLAMKKEMKRWIDFFGLRTWAIIGGLSVLWFLAVYLEGGTEYLKNLLFHQTVDRAINAFHHKRAPWFYCVAVMYSLAPWTLLIIGVMIASLKEKLINTDIERLFLAMSAATFVVLTCISSKLTIYLLPMLPFTVYFAMMQLHHHERKAWIKLCVAIPAVILALTLPVAIVILPTEQFVCLMENDVITVVSIIATAGVTGCYMLIRKHPLCETLSTMACLIGVAVFMAGISVKKLNPSIGYDNVCREAKTISRKSNAPILIDRNIKNAADMDVYLGRITVVDTSLIDTVHGTQKAVLITKGKSIDKIECKIVSLRQKRPQNKTATNMTQ